VHGESAAMFAFGFAVIFFVTQIYGLGLSQRLILLLSGLFVVVVLLYYQTNLIRSVEIFRIPLVLYLGAGLFVVIHLLGKTGARFFSKLLLRR